MSDLNPNQQEVTTAEGTSQVTTATNVQHSKTTIFKDDTLGMISNPVDDGFTSLFDSEITSQENVSIPDFFAKPTIFQQGVLDTTTTNVIWKEDVTKLISSLKKSRMANVYTIRYDTRVTLEINADKFQSGRYILFWLPVAGTYNKSWYNMHCAHLTSITQLPHVEIDIATQTSVTLEIPYVNVKPYMEYSTINDSYDTTPGVVGLIAYSPLDPGTGGSSNCGYTILTSQHNLKIGTLAVNQSASDRERKSVGKGPISNTLTRVAQVASALGKVPGIGLYAQNVAWAASAAGGLAMALGWSKPVDIAPIQRVERRISPMNFSHDSTTTARVLATSSENSVGDPKLSRRNEDELAFQYLKQIYAYVQTDTWTTSQAAQTVIFTKAIIPNNFSSSLPKGFCHTPVGFIATLHNYWRGSIMFRFKLVKTQFHRGRLCFFVAPGTNSGAVSLPLTELVYREIIDVSETSEFEVCVPYQLARAWLSVNERSATVGLFVVDPLVAPISVTQTVKIIMEVSGGPDFEVAVPLPCTFNAYAPAVPQSQYTVTDCVELGSAAINTQIEKWTTGEKLSSFRLYLKQFRQMPNYVPNVPNGDGFSFSPYAIPFTTQTTSNASPLTNPVLRSSLIDVLSCAYAINTGSKRYSFFPISGDWRPSFQVFPDATTADWGTVNNTQLFKNIPYSITNTAIEGNYELQTPVWNPAFSRSSSAHLVNGPASITSNSNDTNLLRVSNYNFGTTANILSYEAAGDDFNMSLFVGFPAVSFHTTT
jgi:hypothetical protein